MPVGIAGVKTRTGRTIAAPFHAWQRVNATRSRKQREAAWVSFVDSMSFVLTSLPQPAELRCSWAVGLRCPAVRESDAAPALGLIVYITGPGGWP